MNISIHHSKEICERLEAKIDRKHFSLCNRVFLCDSWYIFKKGFRRNPNMHFLSNSHMFIAMKAIWNEKNLA